MRGRKNLRRMGIVLGLGALLCAGVMASGALGMALVDPGSTDSTSTAADTSPASTDTGATSTDTSATSTDSSTSTAATTTTESTTTDESSTSTTTTESTTTTPAPTFTPSIVSDKADYSPGATVTLGGAGWPAADAVHIFVNDDVGQTWSYSADVTADIGGTFTLQFPLPDRFIADYTVTADDALGLKATTSFTDANFTFDSSFAVYPYRLAGGLVNIQTGGNGSGNHFLWNRKLPSGSYAYTGLTFNGSSNGSGQNLSLGATASGTYEINVGDSGTIAPSTSCSGSSCGHYGVWGPNQASFTAGQSLTIAGGGAKQSQTSGSGTVTVKLFNPSNTQVGSPLTLTTDANGEYSSGTIRTFVSGDPGGTWRVEISSGARYDNNTGFTQSTNITFVADATPPVITKTITGTLGTNGWYITNVTVAWTVTDSESAAVIDSGCGTQNFTSDTANATSSCSAHSAGGSASDSVTLKIDKTAPSASTALGRAADSSGWYNHAVAWTTSGTDATSGIASCSSGTYSGPDGMGLTVSGTCTDNAGNVSASAASAAFKYDATAPSASTALGRAADSNGWYNHAVAWTTSGTDATSGIASCSSGTYSGPDGTGLTVSGTCTDNAGNVSAVGCFGNV